MLGFYCVSHATHVLFFTLPFSSSRGSSKAKVSFGLWPLGFDNYVPGLRDTIMWVFWEIWGLILHHSMQLCLLLFCVSLFLSLWRIIYFKWILILLLILERNMPKDKCVLCILCVWNWNWTTFLFCLYIPRVCSSKSNFSSHKGNGYFS